MRKKKTYAVFGLGRYGQAVATELVDAGMEVLAVDTDQKKVNDLAAILARRAQALLKKSPKNIGKADSAFLYYTKMMKIAPKVTLSL